MEWLPSAKLEVMQAAVRILPLPLSAALAHPAIVVPESAKLTVPVGAVPLTVAVNVMLAPTAEGLGVLASAVVVLVWVPSVDTCTVSALAVAEITLMLMP